MSLDFPDSPSVNDTYTASGTTWRWDGSAWNVVPTTEAFISVAGSQTLSNKSISGSTNTLSNIPQSAVTDLTGDLSGKTSTSHDHSGGADGPNIPQSSVTDLTGDLASKVDYALTANAQSGTGASAYTFALADASRLTTATGTSAKTFTIPPQTSVTWVANSIIRVANYGAGNLTIAGGSGVTVTNASKTLAQYESAALVRTGSNAWTLIPFSGGAGNADFSNAATGTYTSGGISYKYLTFTASGTLTITQEGWADILVVGGGGGAVSGGTNAGGGGGGVRYGGFILPATTYTVTIGAGGAGATETGSNNFAGNGTTTSVGSVLSAGGGQGGATFASRKDGFGGGGSAGGSSAIYTGNHSTGAGAGGPGNQGLTLAYTGSNVTYGAGGSTTTRGGNGSTTTTGNAGIVVVRVRT